MVWNFMPATITCLIFFLSPATNKRSDAYGGSVENRARLLCECVEMARKVMGPDKIVSVKLAVNEEIAGGIDLDMGVEYAKLCEAKRCESD